MTAPTVNVDLRRKALAVLREARCTILRAECRQTAHDVDEVIARVVSSREGHRPYAVDLASGRWSCTCPGWVQRNECPHITAVQLVTGHAGGPR